MHYRNLLFSSLAIVIRSLLFGEDCTFEQGVQTVIPIAIYNDSIANDETNQSFYFVTKFNEEKEEIAALFDEIIDPNYGSTPDLKSYVRAFPINDYRVINVKNEANFFIDLDLGKKRNSNVKNHIIHNKYPEEHIFKLIKPKIVKGSIVLDIGSNIGTHTLRFSKWVEDGIVYSFEPQPKLFRELFYNIWLNGRKNVRLVNAAVGASLGKVELGPIPSHNEGESKSHGNSGVFADIITIDSLNLNNVSVIKIDVEGMEDEVIEGAKETLLRNKPVIFVEFSGYHNLARIKDEKRRAEILQKIKRVEDLGYVVYNISGHDYVAYPIDP